MEYLFYILAVLIIGLFCVVSIRLFSGSSGKQLLLSEAEKRRANSVDWVLKNRSDGKNPFGRKEQVKSPVLGREVRVVPTPWGWANHRVLNGKRAMRAGLSDTLNSFTDRLVREKQLVETRLTDPRTSGSVRALLEDRYGRINKDSMDSIEYRQVKRPLLRDPNEPHDQMDNFGSKEAERVRAKLARVVSMQSSPADTSKRDDLRYVEIKDVKQPWGW